MYLVFQGHKLGHLTFKMHQNCRQQPNKGNNRNKNKSRLKQLSR